MTNSKFLFGIVAAGLFAGTTNAQYSVSTIANDYTDLAAAGATLILDTGDDAGVTVPLGFSFDFYGASITSIDASTNGYLTTGPDVTDFNVDCPMGNATDPDSMIAPFWFDYNLNDHGQMYAQTTGAAGNQVCTIGWDDVGGFQNSAASYNFQVKLYEADSSIEFHYSTIDGGADASDGSDQAIGTEGPDAIVFTEVSCQSVFDASMGRRLELPSIAVPTLSSPSSACIGDVISMSGTGEPGHFYGIAVSGSNGPTPFGPIALDLGADFVFNIIGLGVIDGAGMTATHSVFAPPTIPCGATGYAQMVTLTLGPIDNVQKSNSAATQFDSCQVFVGTLDDVATTSDHYEITATAGDVITIELCRLESAPGSGCSTLDPRLCVFSSTQVAGGFVGTGTVTNDDGNGDCLFPGCPDGNNYFSASIVTNWVVPADDTYTITASAWGATMGPYELTVRGCSGTVTAVADEVAGGCF